MFESVTSLQELNLARVNAVQAGVDRIQINSAYNLKKKELLSRQLPYKQIPITRPSYTEEELVIYIPYGGKSLKNNTLELTKQGFLC